MDHENDNSSAESNIESIELKTPVSFAADVAVLFTVKDKNCMAGMGIMLDDYMYMSDPAGDNMHPDHANAKHVYYRLTGEEQPQMPLGGQKKWTAADNPEGQKNLKTLNAWMTVEPTYQP